MKNEENACWEAQNASKTAKIMKNAQKHAKTGLKSPKTRFLGLFEQKNMKIASNQAVEAIGDKSPQPHR